MSNDLQGRVEDLEREVQSLRHELNEIKYFTKTDAHNTYIENTEPAIQYKKPLGKLANRVKEDQTSMTQTIQPLKQSQQQKPKKSFEERMIWALPKVFMVILVLGVLWGLKLVSDYGYLSNTIKILLSFALSIALGVIAYGMEVKRKGSLALTITLYGGAFIVGILTTAAGAIIYEVLTLYLALMIAFVYIAYSILISYFKKSEILTNFVAFTSLLLPYLLEYMAFHPFIILLFIVILFALLQMVILKHAQRIALYVTSFFSLLAIQMIWAFGENNDYSFSVGGIVILAIFLYSWWALYVDTKEKLKIINESLLFSISSLALLFTNIMSSEVTYQAWMIVLIAALFVTVALIAYKKQLKRVTDITGTLALLSLLNVLIVLNISENAENLLVPLSAFIGLMTALYLRATLMKITYSFIFTFTTLINITQLEVTPFWSVDHLIIFMQLVYMIILTVYMKRPKATLSKYEQWMKNIFIEDFVPICISAYFLAYMLKVDVAYFSNGDDLPYFVIVVVALLTVSFLFIQEKFIGRFVPYVFILLFLLLAIVLMPTQYYASVEWINLLTRLIYIGIMLAIVADLYMKGAIYRKWSRYLEKLHDSVISGSVIFIALSGIGFIAQLAHHEIISYKLAIATNTIVLFLIAGSALWLSIKRNLRVLRMTGFIVLFIAIVKLVFFDLATLDLFIRAILFMTIGALGLVLSNRLLRKNDE